ncbi:hypothetical protein PoB_001967700 [Plakobranchus ocellatus]|uniref:Uncharacterized protein n=1 Tax=Plakobranchus ocellatus TaxID=259542 RepID=A0AAV3ZF51_9GAST|nr:hypothetical protein PoB_001967700 [Plakobranchus ocellatus]
MDRTYGHVIEAKLEITVTPNMEGSRIICYPDDARRNILLMLAERNDRKGVRSNPFEIEFFPSMPTLKVEYKNPSKVIVEGEIVIAKCNALVERGGTLVWELITTSKKYQWKGRKSKNSQTFADLIAISEREEEFDYNTYEGPRVQSEIHFLASDRMANASLHCYSYEGNTSFKNPVTGDIVATKVSEKPFTFRYKGEKLDRGEEEEKKEDEGKEGKEEEKESLEKAKEEKKKKMKKDKDKKEEENMKENGGRSGGGKDEGEEGRVKKGGKEENRS